MLAHYSHVRLDAKRRALDAISSRKPDGAAGHGQESYVTKHDTKPTGGGTPFFQVIEKNGGDDGTRTRDLCRDRAAF